MMDSSDLAVISVSTVNYLHRARALMKEVARFMPEARRIVYCADPPGTATTRLAAEFELIDAAQLRIPRYRQLVFAMNATGVCCALKPYAALHAFAAGARRVMYVDNDIQLFRRPGEMLSALAEHSFVLTPHLLEPVPVGAQPDDATVLDYGTFNAGMFAAARNEEAASFLRWWGGHTADPASMRPETGYDQIWLNPAPTFMARAMILRDPGYNVASWNLASRPLTLTREGFRIGSVPLTSFHFSWFDEAEPNRLFNPKTTCNYRAGAVEAALLKGYGESLVTGEPAEWKKLPYGFGTFTDGRPISPVQRQVFVAKCWNRIPESADPFAPEFETPVLRGRKSLYHYHEPAARVARFVRRIWQAIPR